MFISKEQIELFHESIKQLQEEVDSLKEIYKKKAIKDIVKCDKCKCLIRKNDAIKGESRIITKQLSYDEWGDKGRPLSTTEEIIAIPYYCLRCKKK